MAARLKPWRVSDRLWAEIEPLLPKVERRFRNPGRRRHDDRACLEGILYVLRYAVPWAELPQVEGWPSGQTCWRRFHEWRQAGVWEQLLARLQELLLSEGLVDWSRAIADASVVDTKKGAARSAALTLRGRSGSRFHLIVDAGGIPFAVRIGPGNENERAHLLPLLDALLARGIVPAELWADRGYDGEQLRAETQLRGVRPVISRRRRASDPPPPAGTPTVLRGNTRRPKPRDPNARHRWPVERTNSWLRNWRRVSTRWERRPDYWLPVIQTAAAMVCWQILEHSFR